MPRVSTNAMQEIVYGCTQLAKSIDREDRGSRGATYSWRLRWERSNRYRDWLMARMNSPDWGQAGDRLEILWGPGYDDRYDYLVFEGGQIRSFFARLPDEEETDLSVVDKRREVDAFDVDQGFRSIGVTVSRPARRRGPESRHVMY